VTITPLRIVGVVLFFLFIILSGFWLSKSGRPFNTGILTIHKLISIGAVVFLAITIYQVNKASSLTTIDIIAVVVTGVFILITIITGGLVSALKTTPIAILRVHQITPWLTTLSTAVTLILLRIGK
jgi:hypothetical protein